MCATCCTKCQKHAYSRACFLQIVNYLTFYLFNFVFLTVKIRVWSCYFSASSVIFGAFTCTSMSKIRVWDCLYVVIGAWFLIRARVCHMFVLVCTKCAHANVLFCANCMHIHVRLLRTCACHVLRLVTSMHIYVHVCCKSLTLTRLLRRLTRARARLCQISSQFMFIYLFGAVLRRTNSSRLVLVHVNSYLVLFIYCLLLV